MLKLLFKSSFVFIFLFSCQPETNRINKSKDSIKIKERQSDTLKTLTKTENTDACSHFFDASSLFHSFKTEENVAITLFDAHVWCDTVNLSRIEKQIGRARVMDSLKFHNQCTNMLGEYSAYLRPYLEKEKIKIISHKSFNKEGVYISGTDTIILNQSKVKKEKYPIVILKSIDKKPTIWETAPFEFGNNKRLNCYFKK